MGPGHRRVAVGTAGRQLTGSVPQLMHPVLESLRGTDRQWLIDTLYAFNSGNVEQFQTLKAAWGQQVSPGRACLSRGAGETEAGSPPSPGRRPQVAQVQPSCSAPQTARVRVTGLQQVTFRARRGQRGWGHEPVSGVVLSSADDCLPGPPPGQVPGTEECPSGPGPAAAPWPPPADTSAACVVRSLSRETASSWALF